MIAEITASAVTVICAGLGYLQVRQGKRNKSRDAKLLRALNDCMTFRKIEAKLCEHVCALRAERRRTAVSVKYEFRKRVYDDGVKRLSDQSSESRLEQEIAKLT